MESSLYHWFKNVSITRKLYFVAGAMALLITIELFAVWFAIHTLSPVQGYATTLDKEPQWSESFLLKTLLVVAFAIQLSGLLITILVSQGITEGSRNMILTSHAIARGDFSGKAHVFSEDEIGQTAMSFNHIVEELQKTINERNLLQEKLKESNKALEEFAYAASHDLREPLRTISSYLQLLQSNYKDQLDEQGNEFIQVTMDGALRMQKFLNSMLTYSRVTGTEEEPEEVDCSKVVETVKENLYDIIRESKAEITVEPLPKIKSTFFQMTQLFQNLIKNAIVFQSEGVPKIRLAAQKYEQEWLFSVQDNGIGIDKKFTEKIFIIFQRLHPMNVYEGTGIGLAICKKIVEQQGGKIWFESEEGKGTTFYFTMKEKNQVKNAA